MEEKIKVMASWWIEMTSLRVNLMKSRNREKIPPDVAEKFKTLFVEKAMSYYEEKGCLPDMSVDYEPCDFLSEVAKEAAIPVTVFPCKSFTTINNDGNAYGHFYRGTIHLAQHFS